MSSKPTCTLHWKRTEQNGTVRESTLPFWRNFPEVMNQVRKAIAHLKIVQGEWEFHLMDAEGKEVPLEVEEAEPVEYTR